MEKDASLLYETLRFTNCGWDAGCWKGMVREHWAWITGDRHRKGECMGERREGGGFSES